MPSAGEKLCSSSSAVLDEYLVIESRLGDERAFSRLVERWHPELLRHAFGFTRDREAARDVVQETWMAIMKGMRSLQDPARFRAWAFRIAANKARDWVRREEARCRALERSGPADAGRADRGPQLAAARRLRAALGVLNSDQRKLLVQHHLEGMSVREIATSLGIPGGTVKSRLFYARNALREALEGAP